MAVARWADTSEHQGKAINALYTLLWFAFRVCDGTYQDHLFQANYNFVRSSKTLVGYIVYSVWPRSLGWSSWQETFNFMKSLIGSKHHPRLVLMDDVESWRRKDLLKDQSVGLEKKRQAEVAYLNACRPTYQRRWPLAAWYRLQDEKRVIGYGNRNDLKIMAGGATKVRWRSIVLADYVPGSLIPKTYLGWNVVGVQHTNGMVGDLPHGTPPWAICDMNRAFVGPRILASKLGLGVLRWSLR